MDRRQFLSPPKVLSPVSPDGYWLHVHRSAMACRFEITLRVEDIAELTLPATRWITLTKSKIS